VVTLQGDRLDAATAEDPANYDVTHVGPDGLFGTADDRRVPIGGVGIDRPIVYNPGANVEISSGLTYPTAVRQTVTLLFADPLRAGSYVVELSSAIRAAPFNEAEADLLTARPGFSGHPVVSSDGLQVGEGARIEAVDLVLQTGALGDLGVFEAGTPFLSQLQNDLGALLDAALSTIGDDPSLTGMILDQILDRVVPGLGGVGQRATSLLAIFLDPVQFDVVDPGGRHAIYDLSLNQLINNIPNAAVVVGGNVEVVIIPITPQAFGTYRVDVAEVPEHARGGWALAGYGGNDLVDVTGQIRAGTHSFSITVGSFVPPPADGSVSDAYRIAAVAPPPNWFGGSGFGSHLAVDPLQAAESLGVSELAKGAGGSEGKRPPKEPPPGIRQEFDRWDKNEDGFWSYDEYMRWWRDRGEDPGDAREVFTLFDKNNDRKLDVLEFSRLGPGMRNFRGARGEPAPHGEAPHGEWFVEDGGEAHDGRTPAADDTGGTDVPAVPPRRIVSAYDDVLTGDVFTGDVLHDVLHETAPAEAPPAKPVEADARIDDANRPAEPAPPKHVLSELAALIRSVCSLLTSSIGA